MYYHRLIENDVRVEWKFLFLRADQYSSALFQAKKELSFDMQSYSIISFDQTAGIEPNCLPIFMHKRLIKSLFIIAF